MVVGCHCCRVYAVNFKYILPQRLKDTKFHKDLISLQVIWCDLVSWCLGGKKNSIRSVLHNNL